MVHRRAIHLINLNACADRLNWLARALGRLGLSFQRFSAVAGAALDDQAQAYHRSPLRAHWSCGEVGCLLSHLDVWQRIAGRHAPFGLVLEDNVHLAPGFAEFLAGLLLQLSEDGLWVRRLKTFRARDAQSVSTSSAGTPLSPCPALKA